VSNCFRGRVERVVDGDTLQVVAGVGNRVKVRLWGLDAPEQAQPYGSAATQIARELAAGEPVVVKVRDTDPYGRIVGRVQTNDFDVGRSLVLSGVAWHQRNYPTSERLVELEKEARRRENGFWEQEHPVPPWHFRDRGASAQKAADAGGVVGWLVFAIVVLVILVRIATGA
jgi:endonuclease YncB( thermonuclease family)